MQSDFYAALGVAPDASQAVIRTAYRRLARRWHPDLNSSAQAAAEFALISEAYAVLGSEERRAAYNRATLGHSALRASSAPQRPICCSECGGVTAQPRILVFRSSIGLGLWSRILRTEGVFCSRCARRSGSRASLLTALAGWWAVPLGPFIAAWCIGLNALGGSRHPKADRRLALLNAQVFLEQENLNLAYALARHALEGAEGADAQKAHDIMRHAKPPGITGRALALKDPWRASPPYLALHALLLLAPPATMIMVVVMLNGG
jgi:hypothetical protein